QLEPPRGSWWSLPGTGPDDARSLASKMSSMSLDRGMVAGGYQPVLTVRFPGGAPRGVPLSVHARLARTAPADPPPSPLFDVDAGQVAFDDRSPRELVVHLPRVNGDEVEDQDWTLHVDVAGRALDLPFHPRRAVRLASARAERAIHDAEKVPMAPGSLESVQFLHDRLVDLAAHGDGDMSAENEEARELDDLSASLEAEQDPYTGRSWRKGAMRRAYRS